MEERDLGERPLAVITAASMGIGLELARELARRGYDLFITSSSKEIDLVADEIAELGANVEILRTDLATFKGTEILAKEIAQLHRPISALIINAGVGVGGDFTETELNDEFHLIRLNIMSPVHLCKKIIPLMKEKGQGRILFTSSISATIPSPFEAVSGASKAFLESFGESLRTELKGCGISVTCLLPDPITNVGSEEKFENDPADVARQGIEAMLAGRRKVFAASLKTKVMGLANRYLPDWVKAEYNKKMSEPGSAH
jgi:short-subunit dehydrogenase